MNETVKRYDPKRIDYNKLFESIKRPFMDWAAVNNAKRFIVAVSGGKDSTVVLNLTVKCFGADKVRAVIIPNGEMKDLDIAKKVCENAGVSYSIVDIGKAFTSITEQIQHDISQRVFTSITEQIQHDLYRAGPLPSAITNNIPPRLRMATAYAIAQIFDGGRVINTSNLSEAFIGWTTMWGDNTGDYAPIADLTCSEVIELGKFMGIPSEFIEKTPSDGLCGKSDEDALGFTYAQLDEYIRTNKLDDYDALRKIKARNTASMFKRDAVHVKSPMGCSFCGVFSDIHQIIRESTCVDDSDDEE